MIFEVTEEEKYLINEENCKEVECQSVTEDQSLYEEVMTKKCLSRVYYRDSMERFGDDLTEEVLSHLWFSDKVMFECLSKQWQRLVFNKQTELHIDYEYDRIERKNSLNKLFSCDKNNYDVMNNQSLVSILKKCPNISGVSLVNNRYGKELEHDSTNTVEELPN